MILRRRREEAGLTQEDLAEAADLHRTYVGLIERGVRSPTVSSVYRICHSLGVPMASVIEEMERELEAVEPERA